MQESFLLLPKETNLDILNKNVDTRQAMSAPYTILVKKLRSPNEYAWIVYSMGSVRNAVWGTLNMNNGKNIRVQFGCEYPTIQVINDMLRTRRHDGFVVVSTLAKDGYTHYILKHKLVNAYLKGDSFEDMSEEDVMEAINQELDNMNIIEPTSKELEEAALNVVVDYVNNYLERTTEKILDAYYLEQPFDISVGNILLKKTLSPEELENMLNDIIRKNNYTGYQNSLELAAYDMAKELQESPNFVQYLELENIPEKVIDELTQFLEYAYWANVKMPNKCISFEKCNQMDDPPEECDVYRSDFALL